MVWSIVLICVVLLATIPQWIAMKEISDVDWIYMRPDLLKPYPKLNNAGNTQKFAEVVRDYWNVTSVGTDGEMIDAVEHFFWNEENGVVLELGASSGGLDTYSQSQIFENFGWKRILIEGNPVARRQASLTEAAYVNLAICEEEMSVHWVTHRATLAVSGIAEFMDHTLVKKFYPELQKFSTRDGNPNTFDISRVDWSSLPTTSFTLMKCYPLERVLTKLVTRRINLLLLSVSGAELEVLRSIDFARTVIDVLVIRKSHNMWVKGVPHQLETFMADKPYTKVGSKGRNLWFRHNDFMPSIKPNLNPRCFRGCVRNYWKGCQPHLCTGKDLDYP